jgi:hypothetical protein
VLLNWGATLAAARSAPATPSALYESARSKEVAKDSQSSKMEGNGVGSHFFAVVPIDAYRDTLGREERLPPPLRSRVTITAPYT